MMSKWAPKQLSELASLLCMSSNEIPSHPPPPPPPLCCASGAALPPQYPRGADRQPLAGDEAALHAGAQDEAAPIFHRASEGPSLVPFEPIDAHLMSAHGAPWLEGGGSRGAPRTSALLFTRLPSSDLLEQVKESRRIKKKSALASALSCSAPGSRADSGERPAPAADEPRSSDVGGAAGPVAGIRSVFDASLGMRINTVRWGGVTSGRPSKE